jgi:hypothetical protein
MITTILQILADVLVIINAHIRYGNATYAWLRLGFLFWKAILLICNKKVQNSMKFKCLLDVIELINCVIYSLLTSYFYTEVI